ncbi:ferritin-like domain-containing protein [Botrimarina sp.]|uniref:YciE/YciF ferroxidase family protein n=1 Tax=Botrimarina sp. TaxID=2795802 RepID=UPI0032EB4648
MNLDSLDKLYVHELKDLYSAETQLLDALPKMADAAASSDLKKAFEAHLKETKKHVSRLEKLFDDLDYSPSGHKCEGMAGLLKEAQSLLSGDADPEVRDAALIGAAQRVEHYEMAAYGTAAAFAEKIGRRDDADTLYETLDEEGRTDRLLSRLAARVINFKALVN